MYLIHNYSYLPLGVGFRHFKKFQNGKRKKGENVINVAVMKNVICDGGEAVGGIGTKHISGTKCKWEYTCVNFRGRY